MPTRPIRLPRRAATIGLAASLLGCSYGPDPDKRIDFVITYAGDGTVLDPAASRLLDRAAAAARAAPDLGVTIAGYADAPLAPQSNQIRSRIRAQLVADALARRGVAPSRIQLTPRRGVGADPGAESGRVEIRIGS